MKLYKQHFQKKDASMKRESRTMLPNYATNQ